MKKKKSLLQPFRPWNSLTKQGLRGLLLFAWIFPDLAQIILLHRTKSVCKLAMA
jgi:hypothetical protein